MNKKILIGGAMDIEIKYFLDKLENIKKSVIGGFDFYEGKLSGVDVVISKTKIGIINAAIATTLGILNFKPSLVINQGTAGAHNIDLHKGDIVIGKRCVNINALEMKPRKKSCGIEPYEWAFSDRSVYFEGDKNVIAKFDSASFGGKKILGTLGSGDIFSREADRIEWIRNLRGNDCEDMESVSVYEACADLGVPCVGIRVISNNELTEEEFDETTAITLQKFILTTIKNLL